MRLIFTSAFVVFCVWTALSFQNLETMLSVLFIILAFLQIRNELVYRMFIRAVYDNNIKFNFKKSDYIIRIFDLTRWTYKQMFR